MKEMTTKLNLPEVCYIEVDKTTIPSIAIIPLSFAARPSKFHSHKHAEDSLLYSPLIRVPKEFAILFKLKEVTDPEKYIEEWDRIDISAHSSPMAGEE